MKKKYIEPTAKIFTFKTESIAADPVVGISNVKAELEKDSFLTLDGKKGRALKRIIALKW